MIYLFSLSVHHLKCCCSYWWLIFYLYPVCFKAAKPSSQDRCLSQCCPLSVIIYVFINYELSCSISRFKYWKQMFSYFSALRLGVIISASSVYMNVQLLEVSVLQWAQHMNSVCKFIWEMLKLAPSFASTYPDNVSSGLNNTLLWNCSFLDFAAWVNVLLSLHCLHLHVSVSPGYVIMTMGCKQPIAEGFFFSNLATLSKAKQTLEIGTYSNTQGQWKVFVVLSISCTFEISVISILIRKGVAKTESTV